MLKSEIKKLENLSPRDYARRFRKIINAFDIFTKKLSEKQQVIVYNLTYNLLEDNYKTASGHFLQKLLKENNISYYDVAKSIYVYLCYTSNDISEDFSLDGIISYLKKMTDSQNFTKNTISDLVCTYFSVDENLIRYGIGNKYHMNEQKAKSAFDKMHVDTKKIDNIIAEILDLNYIPDGVNPRDEDRLCYKELISHNPVLFTEFLTLYLKENINLLEEEACCIWDSDYLKIMFYKLGVKEQNAVLDLIEQLQNL